jgi:hypothetical protein
MMTLGRPSPSPAPQSPALDAYFLTPVFNPYCQYPLLAHSALLLLSFLESDLLVLRMMKHHGNESMDKNKRYGDRAHWLLRRINSAEHEECERGLGNCKGLGIRSSCVPTSLPVTFSLSPLHPSSLLRQSPSPSSTRRRSIPSVPLSHHQLTRRSLLSRNSTTRSHGQQPNGVRIALIRVCFPDTITALVPPHRYVCNRRRLSPCRQDRRRRPNHGQDKSKPLEHGRRQSREHVKDCEIAMLAMEAHR